jgi:hypothetical protein
MSVGLISTFSPAHRRDHPPAGLPARLTSRNHRYDQERTKPQGPGTPPTRRGSRAIRHAHRLKISHPPQPKPDTSRSRNIEATVPAESRGADFTRYADGYDLAFRSGSQAHVMPRRLSSVTIVSPSEHGRSLLPVCFCRLDGTTGALGTYIPALSRMPCDEGVSVRAWCQALGVRWGALREEENHDPAIG